MEKRGILLIDGDSLSAKTVGETLKLESKKLLCNLLYAGVFAGFGGTDAGKKRQAAWGSALPFINCKLTINHQAKVNNAGKNAADIALTIKAMELHNHYHPDYLILFASDSDFTPLVKYLTNAGCKVYLATYGNNVPDALASSATKVLGVNPLKQQVNECISNLWVMSGKPKGGVPLGLLAQKLPPPLATKMGYVKGKSGSFAKALSALDIPYVKDTCIVRH